MNTTMKINLQIINDFINEDFSLYKDLNNLYYLTKKNAEEEFILFPGTTIPAFEEYKIYTDFILLRPLKEKQFSAFLLREKKWLTLPEPNENSTACFYGSSLGGDYGLIVYDTKKDKNVYLSKEQRWLTEPENKNVLLRVSAVEETTLFGKSVLIVATHNHDNPLQVYLLEEKKYFEIPTYPGEREQYRSVFVDINEHAAVVSMKTEPETHIVYLFQRKEYFNRNQSFEFKKCKLSASQGFAIETKDHWEIYSYDTLEKIDGRITITVCDFKNVNVNNEGLFVVNTSIEERHTGNYKDVTLVAPKK